MVDDGPPQTGGHRGIGEVLRVDELILRPWSGSDVSGLVGCCQDPEIARWLAIPQPYSPADAAAFIEESHAMWRDGTGTAFAIVDRATDRLVGAVSRYGPDGHHASIGCWVANGARGRRIGTRALRAVADHTYATTDVIRLEAFILVGNVVAERMVERAGFRREGVLRAWEMVRGDAVDCVAYSRLRGDPDVERAHATVP